MAHTGWELKIRRRSAPTGSVDFFSAGSGANPSEKIGHSETSRPVPTRVSTSPGMFASDVARQIRSQFDSLYRSSPAPRVLQSAGIGARADPWRSSFHLSPPPAYEGVAEGEGMQCSPVSIGKEVKDEDKNVMKARKIRSAAKKEKSTPPPPAFQERSTRVRKAPSPWWSTGITPDMVGKWETKKRNTFLAGEPDAKVEKEPANASTHELEDRQKTVSSTPPLADFDSRKASGRSTNRPRSVEPRLMKDEDKQKKKKILSRASSVPPKVLSWSNGGQQIQCTPTKVTNTTNQSRTGPKKKSKRSTSGARTRRTAARVTFADEFDDVRPEVDSPDTVPVGHMLVDDSDCTSEEGTGTRRDVNLGGDKSDPNVWSQEQLLALQKAQLVLDPSIPNFWSKVAKHVPGKTASDCFNKSFDTVPTPERKKRKLNQKASRSPLKRADAAIHSAAARGKKRPLTGKAAMVTARKYGRGMRYQQKVAEIGYRDSVFESKQDHSKAILAGEKTDHSNGVISQERERVEEDIERRMKMDGYIESLLQKKEHGKSRPPSSKTKQDIRAPSGNSLPAGARPGGWVASAVAAALAIGKEESSDGLEVSQESEDEFE